jgi:hypothetical protein
MRLKAAGIAEAYHAKVFWFFLPKKNRFLPTFV